MAETTIWWVLGTNLTLTILYFLFFDRSVIRGAMIGLKSMITARNADGSEDMGNAALAGQLIFVIALIAFLFSPVVNVLLLLRSIYCRLEYGHVPALIPASKLAELEGPNVREPKRINE